MWYYNAWKYPTLLPLFCYDIRNLNYNTDNKEFPIISDTILLIRDYQPKFCDSTT